ncbi:hypothetical protein GCM10010123_20840 [Pilimelia anulata]|uniref:Phosphoenolpyruvate guanylyltransferase n=1 Tax=Pilimelia anulata TaxID=53371 RepID=A0A8J3B7B8_9ACTN|nr:2-phospho-L-lactate guanylyltransferase [Pilimelia anulata]GGJ90841.1 hypothetical protein GCM10010123_20840 [Pilimelia anulata]
MRTEWTVWIPVKARAAAKSRLALPPQRRAALAEAMLRDVLAAVAAVARPVLLTGDPYWRRLGAPVRPTPPGLTAAVAHAVPAAGPGPVAVLVGDLPALRPAELAAALAAAAGHPRALVADAAGTGTTLLAAAAAAALRPAFGAGSRARHGRGGAADLTAAVDAPGLRRDVDTLADLAAARALGVGPHTARLLAAPAADARPGRPGARAAPAGAFPAPE